MLQIDEFKMVNFAKNNIMKILQSVFAIIIVAQTVFSQSNFNYIINLEQIEIPNLTGLHSYAFAQHEDKWLIIGGRKDGLHARQPFNAFPASQNNTDIFVIDINTREFWVKSLTSLEDSLKEQLQSTNMNFYQVEDTLYFIGGYAFSATENDHITFPKLTTIQVSGLINAVVNNEENLTSFFKQMEDEIFAVCGGQLNKLGNKFYLVGGHRFDGRYNPMGNPTYNQTYTTKIQKFKIDNSGSQLSYSDFESVSDPVHLRRRDYNLIPQVFSNNELGLTISSGVFQQNADLPFLYPVEITESGYTPITDFNQYLSNYHSAKTVVFDSINNENHAFFFGGMSQYYYDANNNLVQDNNVPFVKTISQLTRYEDGTLEEFRLPIEMPGLIGASSEFIPNNSVPRYANKVLKLNEIESDTILLGHIFGGIKSNSLLNPFSSNQTGTTSADNHLFAVKLIKIENEDSTNTSIFQLDGKNPFELKVYPNPARNQFSFEVETEKNISVYYFLTNMQGQMLREGIILPDSSRKYLQTIKVNSLPSQIYNLTLVINNKYYLFEKIVIE